MNSQQRHPYRSSAAGGVLGLVSLILVAAILGGALSAFRSFQTVDNLSIQLTEARHQIDALRDDNARLSAQNREILEQNQALVTYLRRHGLKVPRIADTSTIPLPAEVGDADPKGPTVSGPPSNPSQSPAPGSPAPMPTPTPTSVVPGLGILCDLTPILCTP